MAPSTVTIEEKAWLAGLLDGEACFNCYSPSNHRTSVICTIAIFSSDWRIIARVKDLFNRLTGRRAAASQNKTRSGWTVNVAHKASVCKVISAVARHLVLKRPQAALMHAIASRRWIGTKDGMTPAWAHEYRKKIQWYNRHQALPDGTFRLTGLERTRQSCRKPVLPESQETARDPDSSTGTEGTVHAS